VADSGRSISWSKAFHSAGSNGISGGKFRINTSCVWKKDRGRRNRRRWKRESFGLEHRA